MSGRILILIAVTLSFLTIYGYAAVECLECGAENEPGMEVCVECGAELPAVECIECPECGAVLPVDAEYCDTCGAKFPRFVWEIDFGEWTEGPETVVEMVGSEVYKIEDGHLVMGDGDGRGDEMRAGFTVNLSGFKDFEISGEFSIPNEEGGGPFKSTSPLFDTSTGSVIKITLIGGQVGYSLWARVEPEQGIFGYYRDWKEFIIKEEGDFFKGDYYKGTICNIGVFGKGYYVYSGFDLKGHWKDVHSFSFTVDGDKTTMHVDDKPFELPAFETNDLTVLISVYDDLIAEVWDLRVEALPE
jgi:ribosomal protein L40E